MAVANGMHRRDPALARCRLSPDEEWGIAQYDALHSASRSGSAS